jgi:hypothetical protein
MTGKNYSCNSSTDPSDQNIFCTADIIKSNIIEHFKCDGNSEQEKARSDNCSLPGHFFINI